jgi:hypothetical protein
MSNVSRQIDERDQWLFNASTNDLVGVKNPTGRGEDFLPVRTNAAGTALVSGDGTSFYLGPTSDYEYPPALVSITASQGVVGKSCGLMSVKCVAGSAIALTVYDNATIAAGTVLFSQTMSAGDAAIFPAPVQAINGVWAAFTGTATFELEVQDAI